MSGHDTPFEAQPALNLQAPTPAEKPDEQRGLRCPKCGCEHFRVNYRCCAWGEKILHSRECRHCGRRVITYEHIAF